MRYEYAEGEENGLIVGLKRAVASLKTEKVCRPNRGQLFEMPFNVPKLTESLSKPDNSQLQESSRLYQQIISLYLLPQNVIS